MIIKVKGIWELGKVLGSAMVKLGIIEGTACKLGTGRYRATGIMPGAGKRVRVGIY